MKAKRFLGLILALLLLVAPSAYALTLADLIKQGSIVIDDKEFYGFAYTPAGAAPTADEISVVEINTAHFPGLRFVAPWAVQAGEKLDSNISFFVKVLAGGAPITDVHGLMAGVGFTDGGFVNLAENVFDAQNNNIANIFLFADQNGMNLSQLDFLAQSTLGPIFVVKDIILEAGDGRAALSFVENRFSEVPEPGILILLGLGLSAVGVFSRRVKF